MNDEYKHLFYLTSYIDGPLFDYTDEINNVYPIDEMIIKLKNILKHLNNFFSYLYIKLNNKYSNYE